MQVMQWLNLCGLVLALLIPTGWSMGTKDLEDTSRWPSYEPQSAQNLVSNMKRHSEGTFTSDFTRYLDKMKAKDFVHWLINTKRFSSSTKRYLKEEPHSIPTKRYLKEEPHSIPFPAASPLLVYN